MSRWLFQKKSRRERYKVRDDVARLKGLEPLAYCLEGSCSIQLSYRRIVFVKKSRRERYAVRGDMERVMGIEPTRPAWKAGVLPLNYTRASATEGILAHPSGYCQEPIGIFSHFPDRKLQGGMEREQKRLCM